MHQHEFKLLPASALLWSHTVTSPSSAASEQTAVCILFEKRKDENKPKYTGTIDKIVSNGFELDAREQEQTIYSASPPPTAITKFKKIIAKWPDDC